MGQRNVHVYGAEVEIAKSYVGMPRPDAETANRIVTLVLKMMEYAQVVFDAESEAKKLALESLSKEKLHLPHYFGQLRRPTNDGIGRK